MNTTNLVDEIAEGLVRAIGPDMRQNAERGARSVLQNSKASRIMTFVTPTGRRYAPAWDLDDAPDYAKAVWCFVREKPMNGAQLDSAITQDIVDAIEEAVTKTFNSDKAASVVADTLARAGASAGAVRKEMRNDAAWVSREIVALSGVSPAAAVSDQISDIAAQQASDLLNTTAGKALLATIAQVAASTVGKVVIMKMIQTSAIAITKSTAAKAAVGAALKKVGIVLIVKAVIVKAVAAMAPGLLTIKIPIFWILAPIVAFFVHHEMKNMPSKLAEKVPPQVGARIEASFPEMARSFAQMLLAQAVVDVAKQARQA